MNYELIKEIFLNVGSWKNSGKVAPHKSLLLLYALGKLLKDGARYISYLEIKDKLKPLLLRYSNSTHPEYPYVYLKTDGIWTHDIEIQTNRYSIKQLNATCAGFTDEVFNFLVHKPELIKLLIRELLNNKFSYTLHEDILDDLDMNDIPLIVNGRDPVFRKTVLRNYEFRCVVCNYSIHISGCIVGLEAAHIMGLHYGGNNNEDNGLALCALHHKLFDYGAFTITKDNSVIVSANVLGNEEARNILIKLHGKVICIPDNPQQRPNKMSIEWHNDVVFKKPSRYIG